MKNKLLSDHKKIGKVFQPPIIAMGTFVETSWLDFGVPEFIWIHILCEEYGAREGSILFIEFTKISDTFLNSKSGNGVAATMISSYSILSENEKKDILQKLHSKALLPRLRLALMPFLSFYPQCPLNFVIQDTLYNDHESKYLVKYKECLTKIMDKSSFEATITIANVISFLNHFGRLKITESSHLPQLTEILNYPNTEDSKHLASFLRSTISTFFNNEWGYNRNNEWLKYFWNQSLRLEPIVYD